MAIISFEVRKDSNKTENFLKKALQVFEKKFIFEKYGKIGVEALRKETPKDSGLTADSWYYEIIEQDNGNVTIEWNNSNVNKYVNIAVIIQTGHGTGTGGYVKGIDYINPAMRPVFQEIADNLWREVTR